MVGRYNNLWCNEWMLVVELRNPIITCTTTSKQANAMAPWSCKPVDTEFTVVRVMEPRLFRRTPRLLPQWSDRNCKDILHFGSPYFAKVFMIASISAGPSFFRMRFPMLMTSRISPCCFHTWAPIIHAVVSLSLGNTLTATSKNCSSVYGGKNNLLNRDCNGLDSR
jgi:hypothetical protein